MNSRAPWTLFACALALLALILLVERPLRQASQTTGDPKLFPGLVPSAVTRVRLRWRNHGETLLVRSNSQWNLAVPLHYPTESNRVERFLEGLAALEWQTHLTAADVNARKNALEDFGLASPLLSLTLQAGGKEQTLLVGSVTALGDQVFAQIVGGDGCYLAGSAFLKLIPPDPNEWRDRRLIEWAVRPGDRVKVVSPPGTFELECNPSNRLWSLVWPLPARADNQKLLSLLSALGDLRVTGFVSDAPAPDLDAFGLRTPALQILLGRGTNYQSGVLVGSSPSNAPGMVYASRPDSPSVFLLSSTNLDPWRVSLTEFRDRHIVTLASNEVALIEIQGADTTRVARAEGGKWRFISPSLPFEPDPGLVDGIISVLGRTDVNFEKAVVTDFAAYGLTSPPLRLLVWREPDARPDSLIARVDFGSSQDGKVFVRREDESSVNSISAQEYESLPRVSWQLRDRRVWSFPPDSVFSVRISQKGEQFKLAHGGPKNLVLPRAKHEWSVAPGYEGFINPYLIEEAVTRLGSLQAVAWSGRGLDAPDLFGVKGADHEVTFVVKEGSRMNEMTIQFGGRSASRNTFARVVLDGEPWFFEIPAELYREFVAPAFSVHPPPGR